MRANRLFWGLIILLIGVVLLLMNLGLITGNFWWVLWPLILISLGVWFLIGPMFSRGQEVVNLNIPLESTLEADINLQHGAGRLTIEGQSSPDDLLQGSFTGGVDHEIRRDGSTARINLKVPSDVVLGFPWFGTQGFNWKIALNPAVPMRMKLSTGAGESHLDLSRLSVRDLRLETGASSTNLTLPAKGLTRAEIKSGAAAVYLRIPESMAARIEIESGLAGITVDTHRFPKIGNAYESPDYATAVDRTDIKIETGVGSVDIR